MIVNRYGLENHGIRESHAVHWNIAMTVMVEQAIRRGEGQLAANGALVVRTGSRTGRSPKDKFIVRDATTDSSIDWGSTNVPIEPDVFDRLHARIVRHFRDRELFVIDAWAGADPHVRMPIRVVTEFAWHALFARQLFRKPSRPERESMTPEFTVLSAPLCLTEPGEETGLHSDVFVIINFSKKLVLVGGTQYAGEIKKSIFSILNYLLPQQGIFPMHCSANVGPENDTALFFGLSGTGKTTLSADATRRLIGDDEHGWTDRGIFNFEGGCYAKCIRLSPKSEPQIFKALKFGTVLENVVMDPHSREPDYDDGSVTENSRAAYPIDFIDNAVPEGLVNAHPKAVVFLTCDAFGVLPPVSRLTTQQAMYHFLSGYTAKVAGTEAGMGNEPQATFSTCFGAPFMPRTPMTYAKLLAERVEKHRSRCWLINTGWSGGGVGVGSRMKLDYTRAVVNAALSGKLDEAPCKADPIFGVLVPQSCPDVPANILQPKSTWKSGSEYDAKARDLAGRFATNFRKFAGVSAEVAAAGPKVG